LRVSLKQKIRGTNVKLSKNFTYTLPNICFSEIVESTVQILLEEVFLVNFNVILCTSIYNPMHKFYRGKKKSCYTIPKTFRFKVFFPSLNKQKPSLCLSKNKKSNCVPTHLGHQTILETTEFACSKFVVIANLREVP